MTWKQWIHAALKGPRADPWSTVLALWAIATSLLFTLDALLPSQTFDPITPLDNAIPDTIVVVDALFYLAGGGLVLTGLVTSRLAENARRPINLEQVGWILTVTAAAANLLIIMVSSPKWALSITWTTTVILGGIGRLLQLMSIERRADMVAGVLAQVEANNRRLGASEETQ